MYVSRVEVNLKCNSSGSVQFVFETGSLIGLDITYYTVPADHIPSAERTRHPTMYLLEIELMSSLYQLSCVPILGLW